MISIERNTLNAWLVHLFTASGLLWGFLAILAIVANSWRLALLWMSVAVAVDAVDGPLSRRLRARQRLPQFDGALLDAVVDFQNYVVVPVLFMHMAGLLPAQASVWAVAIVLLASGYWFGQSDAKTSDNYFKGFPSYWNVTVFYLFLFGWDARINLAIVLALSALVFVPIKYFYPTRAPVSRTTAITIALFWGALGLVVLLRFPNPQPWALWGSLACALYYVLMSIRRTLIDRRTVV
ncbi:MAG: CDP-alcohol phosphatidyltransferase family protein [Anaerolineales bacterium]|jgi:phosphatidylcholine synthase|nr:CDP-alcohol phosphatidyltransferase family protein [Anaerolineales bacterium]MDP7345484.1 CDP-alcohol phosphatidyltransferase family protein [Anaerolineales bacterium]MDP7644428.1 CDP-alcohol phosphatidyltransferase family protein [Anaerolineales bacterium]HJN41467.1 hypothetical protein [Anaerolineales bacterium]|tara:strand:+ start:240 stop:950 length:711 start_codon:yes stop_codon:yes gene_type:complete